MPLRVYRSVFDMLPLFAFQRSRCTGWSGQVLPSSCSLDSNVPSVVMHTSIVRRALWWLLCCSSCLEELGLLFGRCPAGHAGLQLVSSCRCPAGYAGLQLVSSRSLAGLQLPVSSW